MKGLVDHAISQLGKDCKADCLRNEMSLQTCAGVLAVGAALFDLSQYLLIPASVGVSIAESDTNDVHLLAYFAVDGTTSRVKYTAVASINSCYSLVGPHATAWENKVCILCIRSCTMGKSVKFTLTLTVQ
jgi:hypothetical protein